jgi:hypothetical protein
MSDLGDLTREKVINLIDECKNVISDSHFTFNYNGKSFTGRTFYYNGETYIQFSITGINHVFGMLGSESKGIEKMQKEELDEQERIILDFIFNRAQSVLTPTARPPVASPMPSPAAVETPTVKAAAQTEVIACPDCGYDNKNTNQYCEICYKLIQKKCSQCENLNPLDSEQCQKCQTTLGGRRRCTRRKRRRKSKRCKRKTR